MKILFKWVTTGLIAVVTLVSATIIYVSLAVDINGFKPDIESLAKQQNWDITIDGDLAWTFFPQPGISIGQVRFADQTAAPSSLAGTLDSLTLSVSWIDLLSTAGDVRQLQGGSVQANGGQVLYNAHNSLPVQLDNLSFKTRNIRLDGTAFPLTASLQALGGQQVAIEADVALVANNDAVQSLSLSDLTVRLNDIEINGNIEASNSLSFIQGNLKTNTFSLIQQLQQVAKILPIVSLPKMANPTALSELSIESRFTIDSKSLSDINNVMMLDGQAIEIDLEIDQPRNKLTTIVSAEFINALNYLPKPGSKADNSSLFAPLAIPFALWRGQSQVEITIDSIQFNDFAVDDFYSNAFGNNRVLRLTSLNADLFGGQINAIAKLDMRPKIPTFNIQPSLTAINLALALPALADTSELTGSLNLQANIQGAGDNRQGILKSLTGNGQFDIAAPSYSEMNIEQTFCTAASLFGGSSQTSPQWAKGTQLDNLNGRFQFTNGRLLVRDYTTATGNLTIDGNATVHMLDQKYDLRANALLSSSTTSNNGCSVNSQLQNRPIPFNCKGRFGQSNDSKSTPAFCKPDERALKGLLKNTALEKLGEQLFDGPDDENNPLQNLLQDFLQNNLK